MGPAVTENHSLNRQKTEHCDTACKISIGIAIPVFVIVLIAIVTYMTWGKDYLAQRRQAKAEKEIAERKLGKDDDTNSLDREVRRIEDLEAARLPANNKSTAATGPNQPTASKSNPGANEPAQSHQHDHVLAMIYASR